MVAVYTTGLQYKKALLYAVPSVFYLYCIVQVSPYSALPSIYLAVMFLSSPM